MRKRSCLSHCGGFVVIFPWCNSDSVYAIWSKKLSKYCQFKRCLNLYWSVGSWGKPIRLYFDSKWLYEFDYLFSKALNCVKWWPKAWKWLTLDWRLGESKQYPYFITLCLTTVSKDATMVGLMRPAWCPKINLELSWKKLNLIRWCTKS